MIKILFIRSENANLPEIDAYINYFNKIDNFIAIDSKTLNDNYDINDFDVLWEFKGIGGYKKKDNQMLIHEYASLSTGNLPKIKNCIKRNYNETPDLRVFLNEFVKKEFKFKDIDEYCFRDMGIDEHFLKKDSVKKEFDFVYVGEISKSRNIDIFLSDFSNASPGKLCLIGNVDNEIYKKYRDNKDIIFTGKVPYLEVQEIATKAIYGINYIPNKYPFNIQTSTKLLEYLAMGLKIITTDYYWVNQFEKKNNANFYRLEDNKINMENLKNHKFKSEFNAKDFLWDKVIEKSNIEKHISKYFS